MNLRKIIKRQKDSTSEVVSSIEEVQETLDSLGVDYEPQDIGEPDVDYLAYLQDMTPEVSDSVKPAQEVSTSDKLSTLIPALDFPANIDGGFIDSDDSVRVDVYEPYFTSYISAGNYEVVLFGVDASLVMSGTFKRSDIEDMGVTDGDIDLDSSNLELDAIAGVYVEDKTSKLPVVYISGSETIVTMGDFSKTFSEIKGKASSAPQVSLPMFGIATEEVLDKMDSILKDFIGVQTYKATSTI